jgi:hypothetical protein
LTRANDALSQGMEVPHRKILRPGLFLSPRFTRRRYIMSETVQVSVIRSIENRRVDRQLPTTSSPLT